MSTVKAVLGCCSSGLGVRGPMGRPRGPGLNIRVDGSMKGRGEVAWPSMTVSRIIVKNEKDCDGLECL